MAVVIRDLSFSYKSGLKSNLILSELNMNVSDGSIYALLGPSGCGKTTILNIIIGLRKAQSGSVRLYGYKNCCQECGIPGAGVGYMPQEIGLQFDLTINEILYYFGTFQMMTAKQIKKESQWLIKRFNLPEKTKFIGQLSGGQKRLVSLAVALLHKPRLLILDEPTVGVDPLLRTVIWNHLLDLSVNENVTTIITTHYIDEAKRANVVAFMRKGEILSEGDPNYFLDAYNAATLDEVFLVLCKQQGPRQQSLALVSNEEINEEIISKKPFKRTNNVNSFQMFFQITKSLIKKHFIETRRNPMALFSTFLFTFMTTLTVMFVLGSPPFDLKVAWVNDDPSVHVKFSEYIYKNTDVNGTLIDPSNSNVYLPNLLRNSLNTKVIQVIEYNSLPEALQSLEVLTVYGIIYFKTNFSEFYTLCDPIMNYNFDTDCSENETIANATVTLYTDPTNPILSDAIKFSVGYSIQRFRIKVARMIGINEQHLMPPFQVEVLTGDSITENVFNFEHFTAPGFLTIAPFGFSASLCILAIIAEKQSDMSIRNYVSGVKPHHTLLAEVIARFCFVILSTILNIFATIKFFGLPCRGSILLIILLSAMQVLLGVTQGILFSSLFSKSMLSFFTCSAVLIGSVLTTGAIWSVESQPLFYQWINYILPFSHSIKSMRTLLIKQNATFHPQVSMGFIMTSIYIVFNIIFTLLWQNFKQ